MSNYNIVKNPNESWDAKLDHAQRSSFHSHTQSEAEAAAKQFAANSGGGEVRIHGLDGRIRDSDTVPPARDPFPQEIKNIKILWPIQTIS